AEQGRALGTNQSLQTGAEGASGLAGGGLAAISTALPLPVMGALALLGSALLARPAARAAAAPAAAQAGTRAGARTRRENVIAPSSSEP
ncbi:MAG TPA: hypothetical protein VHA80_12070, partial [Solirubrobacterales bacterium]|nr:hypothetical protein [Solirubrobacterales bacterium]